jgi:hypothetical protein
LEFLKVGDQLRHRALALIGAMPSLFARQGAVLATWRRRNGKLFGPYYRLDYRLDGRRCSIYLGRAGELVQQVRQALGALQQRLAAYKDIDRLMRRIRAALRAEKVRLGRLMQPLGLRLKGFEVRGWRFSPLRGLLARCPRPRLRVGRGRPKRIVKESPLTRVNRVLAARTARRTLEVFKE